MNNNNEKLNVQLNSKLNIEYKNVKIEPISVNLIEEIERNEDYIQNEVFPVTYFPIFCIDLDNPDFQDKIVEFNAHYFLFLQFMKRKMLQRGKYYICEKNIKRFIKEYCYTYDIDIENIMNIYNDLIENNYMSIIKCPCFEEAILTEPTVVYVFKLVQEQRVRNRKKKRKERANKKAETKKDNNKTEEAPSEPLPEVKAVSDDTSFSDNFGFGEVVDNGEFF